MARLTALPLELQIAIFGALHCVKDAHNLSSTCKSLRHIWRLHSHVLLDVILPRQICCYDNTLRLFEAQKRVESANDIDAAHEEHHLSHEVFQTRRLRQMHRNARQGERICDYIIVLNAGVIESGMVDAPYQDECCRVHPSTGLPHERERAIQSIYFLRAFVLAQSKPALSRQYVSQVKSMGNLRLYVTWSIMDWVALGNLWRVDWELDEQLNITYWDRGNYCPGDAIEATTEWESAWQFICAQLTLRNKSAPEDNDGYSNMVHGPCDICLRSCLLTKGENIWEVRLVPDQVNAIKDEWIPNHKD